MARNGKVQKKRKPTETKGGRVRRGRPKVCLFCSEHIEWVDYKDTTTLRRFLNDRGRIKARGATGTCAQHQRDVAIAIKTARELVMLPYVVRTLSADKGDRRGGGPKRGRPSGAGPNAEGSESGATDADADATDTPDVDADAGVDELAVPA